jgi:hypothetical protein
VCMWPVGYEVACVAASVRRAARDRPSRIRVVQGSLLRSRYGIACRSSPGIAVAQWPAARGPSLRIRQAC